MGIDNRRPLHKDRVAAARKQFDLLMPPVTPAGGGPEQPQQPDVVIVHANHWTLKIMFEGHITDTDKAIAALPVLPEYYVESFVKNLTMLVLQVGISNDGKEFINKWLIYDVS